MYLYILSATESVIPIPFYNKEWFIILKDISEIVAAVATAIGIIAIWITIVEFKRNQKREEDALNFSKSEKSIELLSLFANDIIPEMEKFDDLYNKEMKEFEAAGNSDGNKKDLIKKIVKKKLGIGQIFNRLEHLCLYIEAELVNSSIVYSPLNGVLVEFVNEHQDVFSDYCQQAPYKNLNSVYKKWTKEQKLAKIKDEKDKLTQKENELKSET